MVSVKEKHKKHFQIQFCKSTNGFIVFRHSHGGCQQNLKLKIHISAYHYLLFDCNIITINKSKMKISIFGLEVNKFNQECKNLEYLTMCYQIPKCLVIIHNCKQSSVI